ncbi:helix-turn-helix domain-containing protein [Oceanicoccus sagamiensis]|uniref:Transcriptional regulator n=1 Tax=Oceanicoccus sagamiensis TaxID=716816 RepID=A0A1X9N8X9_9GAMM|nr:helix-turn-helix domain-containing protein [Oceanicoccus sagamiensis]ARN72892.1 transcriptional regulator [Oceanicoccus sagamiensis]
MSKQDNSNDTEEISPSFAFERFLKFWRSVHSLSQEELAFRVDSSPRHISRLENGSSRPSENLVIEISKAMNLGRRDSNHLLISAGYAPIEPKVDFHSPELKWLRKAMTKTLRALDPYPTVLLDRSTNIVMVNRAWVGFYLNHLSQQSLDEVSNHYDFLFSREGVGNMVSNWEDTLSVILMSLKQIALFSDSEEDHQLLERLKQHPSVPEDWQQRGAALEPMASFRVQMTLNDTIHRFFSVSSTVGALGPNAYTSEPNLSIHTLYPEDDDLDLSTMINPELKHPLLFY